MSRRQRIYQKQTCPACPAGNHKQAPRMAHVKTCSNGFKNEQALGFNRPSRRCEARRRRQVNMRTCWYRPRDMCAGWRVFQGDIHGPQRHQEANGFGTRGNPEINEADDDLAAGSEACPREPMADPGCAHCRRAATRATGRSSRTHKAIVARSLRPVAWEAQSQRRQQPTSATPRWDQRW